MTKFLHGGDVWKEGNPESWIDFSANLNPKGPPQEMIRALKESVDKIAFYPEVNMDLPTKNIACYINMPIENVLPTNGGIGALNLIVEEIRPKKVIILQPAFVEYHHLAQNIGAEIIHVPIIDERNHINYNEDIIISSLDRDSMLFICNPSNPIGCTMPQEIMLNILGEAKDKGSTVVVDEAFIEFSQKDSVKNEVYSYENLIIAGSLTKIFAIPGIRLGYICADVSMIRRFKHRQTPWAVSSFSYAITDTLKDLDYYINSTIEENSVGRYYLTEQLKKMDITVYPSKANYLLLHLKNVGIQVTPLQQWLRKSKILIRNCANYIFLDDYYTRIAVKSKMHNTLIINALQEYINKEPKW